MLEYCKLTERYTITSGTGSVTLSVLTRGRVAVGNCLNRNLRSILNSPVPGYQQYQASQG